MSPLGNRIYLDDKGNITTPGPDADKWRQCWTCGLIVGVYEAKPEVELDTVTEPKITRSSLAVVLRLWPVKVGRLTNQVRPRESGN